MVSKSGFGCHAYEVFILEFYHANDITICCPSVSGLNEMLK